MPIHIVLTTPQEMFSAAIKQARDLSEKILKLSDLNITPLAPGETPDARRHQIAKFGKALAEAFTAVDAIIEQTVEHFAQNQPNPDVTAGAPGVSKPDDPNSN